MNRFFRLSRSMTSEVIEEKEHFHMKIFDAHCDDFYKEDKHTFWFYRS
ncbi:hypothetical protein [Brevibacillus formosus]|nr:hypothetical protein [Brevibacillus formosus]